MGRNDNPTPLQLRRALRKILVGRIDYSFDNGNCVSQEKFILPEIQTIETEPTRRETDNEIIDFDHTYITEYESLTLYVDNAVVYIAGFVARHVGKTTKCSSCKAALTISEGNELHFTLINVKNNGGLKTPSSDVIIICKTSEKIIRQVTGLIPLFEQRIKLKLTLEVMQFLSLNRLFNCLNEHELDNAADNSHTLVLVKKIISTFLDLRLRYIAKIYSTKIKGISDRQHLNKMILFRGY